jgi:phenylalanyl-tRNA synthetase beta chain
LLVSSFAELAILRAPDRTLTQAEVTDAKQAGVALAAERFGAAIRD